MSEGASSSNEGQVRRRGETVVLDHGRRKGSCGYCKSPEFTSISHGLWAHAITVDDFQDLLDQGWRRSGSYLYKPEMNRTCCPSYTIRLKASNFVPSKEQKRVRKKMERFLDGILDLKRPSRLNGETNSTIFPDAETDHKSSSRLTSKPCEDERLQLLERKINDAVKACFQSSNFPHNFQLPRASVKRVMHESKKRLKEISEGLAYTSGIAFQIAATLQRYQITHKNNPQNVPKNVSCEIGDSSSFSFSDPSPCAVAQGLACAIHVQEAGSSEMTVKACNGHLNFYSSGDNDFPPTQQSPKDGSRGNDQSPQLNSQRKLEIRIKRSSFDPEEFELYRRYQIRVHDDKPDKVTKSQYYRFLVETPLQFVSGDSKYGKSMPPCGFGSFHQQYRIDGKLVAVGVVDILPRCLSSKYLFWDPDMAFLSLGKYSALREIDWVRQSEIHCPSLQYYYLGYYIHSCSKMRYKATYHPSELLCPLRYEWVPFGIARTLLDKKSYVVLSDYASFQDGESSSSQLREDSNHSASNYLDHGGGEECSSNEYGEMEVDVDSQESESESDELDPETKEHNAPDVSGIVLELDGTRVKFKEIQQLFGPIPLKNLRSLELQLRRYARTVGPRLARTIIYRLS